MRHAAKFGIALVLLVLLASAQAPTGSSIAFGSGTGSCQNPTTGQDILCGSSSGLQVSNNGANYVPVTGNTLNYQNALAAVTSNGPLNDITLYTYTLPGGTIGGSQGVRIEGCFKHTTGSTVSTYKLKFGATSMTLISGANGTMLSCFAASVINNPGVTNAQQMLLLYGTPPGIVVYTAQIATPAEDTTASVTLLLTANCSGNTDQWTPESWLVTKIQ